MPDIDLADFSRQLRMAIKKLEKAEIDRMYHAGYDVATAIEVLKGLKEDNGTR